MEKATSSSGKAGENARFGGGADRQVTSPLGQSSGYIRLCGSCHLLRSTEYFELHGWESVYTKVGNRGIYIYTMHEEVIFTSRVLMSVLYCRYWVTC